MTYRHPPKGKPRRVAGTMNKLEQAYSDVLAHRLRQGEVLWYKYEGIKLRLADNTFYTPDFFVMTKDYNLELHEVKGFWEDDARVKIKVTAELFPFRVIAVTRAAKKDGGDWVVEEF